MQLGALVPPILQAASIGVDINVLRVGQLHIYPPLRCFMI